MNRHHSRMLAMQALCQWEVLGEALMGQLDEFLKEEAPQAEVVAYARTLVEKATANSETIDSRIQEAAANWNLSRIAPVERGILRVAVCELLYRPDVPQPAAVNEAVELGKKFGTAESGAFINGVLDAIVKKLASATASVGGLQSEGDDGPV
jgi:N utilization substance protein B